jgi:hypothetical protein
MRLLSKRTAVFSILAGSVITLVAWTQNWVSLNLSSAEIKTQAIEATGQASTVLPAGLALVAIATALVLLTTRGVLAYVISALNLAVAVALLAIVVAFAADPVSFEFKQLSALSGISDHAALRFLVSNQTLGWGLWLCGLGALAIMFGAVVTALGTHRWPARRSKYERAQSSPGTSKPVGPVTTLDAWDEMSRGTDPTS